MKTILGPIKSKHYQKNKKGSFGCLFFIIINNAKKNILYNWLENVIMKTKLLNISDIPIEDGSLNHIQNVILKENNLDPNNFYSLFPDYNNIPMRITDMLSFLSPINKTEEFVNEVISNHGKHFCIIGDYDVDGIFATAILSITLSTLGETVDYVIPNRFEDGYGMKMHHIDKAIERGAECIITVDNGIGCKVSVEYALSKGLHVIVTDHHIPDKETTPTNVLVIDPKYNDDVYVDSCGATVSFKLSKALLENANIYDTDLISELAFFAAVATVTDSMPLLGENRLLVQSVCDYIDFLKTNRLYHVNRVLKVLSALGGRFFLRETNVLANPDLFGFSIGPAVNAYSRVDGDCEPLIDAILKMDEKGLSHTGDSLDMNKQRQAMTARLMEDVKISYDPVEVFLFDKNNYDFEIGGLLGLIASRITNDEQKVSIIGLVGENEFECSARSIPGYSIFDGVERVRLAHPELGISGGGHANAMGLRMPINVKNFNLFKQYINKDFIEHHVEIENHIFHLEPEYIDYYAQEIAKFNFFGNSCKNIIFTYTGVATNFDNYAKMLYVGDYMFKTYKIDEDIIGKTVTVRFEIKTNDKTGPYFKTEKVIK